MAITGDITYSGMPSEYDLAAECLTPLLQKFFPAKSDWRERVLLVPGNHDVDLRVCAADQIKYSFKLRRPSVHTKSKEDSHRRLGLQAFRDFAWRLSGNSNWRDSSDLIWVNESFRHLGVRFYMISTAAMMDSRNPTRYEVPVHTLEEIAEIRNKDKDMCGIALLHHGPPIYDEEGKIVEAGEAIANWDKVRKALQQSPIRIILHGHGHDRKTDFVGIDETLGIRKAEGSLERDEVLRVMAPTSHLAERVRTKGSSRGFNIVTLKRDHGRVTGADIAHYELRAGGPREARSRVVTVTL